MEPAVRRREHACTGLPRPAPTARRNGARRQTAGAPGGAVVADRLDHAAMEPAAKRQEHYELEEGLGERVLAAMEPAVRRREHIQRVGDPVDHDRAALEPAVGRREHLDPTIILTSNGAMPQWSPPFNGGSTLDSSAAQVFAGVAAMEPAVRRREHAPCGGFDGGDAHPAAMKPAVRRREHTSARPQTASRCS